MKQYTVIKIICTLLVFLFVYAAVSKLANWSTFVSDMNNQPFPAFLKPVLVWAVPLTELAIAGLLLFDTTRVIGLYASLLLMVVFTLYTAVVLLHFFAYVPCSCGGIIKNLSWGQHLVFNGFFVLIAITGILKYPLKPQHYKTE
jgi:putative oxidoreductase